MARTGEQIYHHSCVYFEPMDRRPNEIFVPIPEALIPGVNEYYLISNWGRLWHKYNCFFFKYNTDSDGYYYKTFKTKYGDNIWRIHRLVKCTFDYQPGCERTTVRFKNNNKGDLSIWNLCWGTDMPIECSGASYNTCYSDEVIHAICRMLEARNCTMQVIANTLNVPYTLVQSVQGGYTRTDISGDYNIVSRKIPANFTEEEIVNLCRFFSENYKKLDIYPTRKSLALAGIAFLGKDINDRHLFKSAKKILGRETYTSISCNYEF